MRIPTIVSLAAAAGACALLAGCVDPQRPLSADWGVAARANLAAQTADPDAHYVREIEPASNGDRINAANERYEKGQVIRPEITSTQSSK
jgi:hypothetical protein